jgi:hypothetical protein
LQARGAKKGICAPPAASPVSPMPASPMLASHVPTSTPCHWPRQRPERGEICNDHVATAVYLCPRAIASRTRTSTGTSTCLPNFGHTWKRCRAFFALLFWRHHCALAGPAKTAVDGWAGGAQRREGWGLTRILSQESRARYGPKTSTAPFATAARRNRSRTTGFTARRLRR